MAEPQPSLRDLIERDLANRERTRAAQIERLRKNTVVNLLNELGSHWRPYIEVDGVEPIDGLPAPRVQGWRFWSPDDTASTLLVWAAPDKGSQVAWHKPSWHPVTRWADLAELISGEDERVVGK